MANKAFLVGINKYRRSPLRGCVNDVLLMYKVLSEKFNFDTNNIDICTDNKATKHNIINGLKKLTQGASSGDILLFHYSGHGSQVVVDDWTNTTEADGRDEILCPVDLNWDDPLRDHQLGKYLSNVPSDVTVVCILDCCHSGTGLRNSEEYDEYDVKNRFLAPPPDNILLNPKISLDDDLNYLIPAPNPKDVQTQKRSFLVNTVNEQGNTILISGCQDNQTSADAFISSRYHGALTYTLVYTLKQNNFNISYKELVTKINEQMDQYKFTQNPQLECPEDKFNKIFLK